MSLEKVEAGDRVILVSSGHLDSIEVVSRVTRTQVIINTMRFRKSTGFRITSDNWCRTYIRLPREGEVKKIEWERRVRDLRRRIAHACEVNRLRPLPLRALERINRVITEELEDAD